MRENIEHLIRQAVTHGLLVGNIEADAFESTHDRSTGTRRLSGVQPVLRVDGTPMGEYFSRFAHQAHASSESFQMLGLELYQLKAPPDFIRAANSVSRMEARQCHVMQELARRFCALPSTYRPTRRVLRDLYGLALDQAGDGSVRSLFRAALLSHMAMAAQDPGIRTETQGLCEAAVATAAFAEELLEWCMSQLSPRRRRMVLEARERELADLRRELHGTVDPLVSYLGGVPQEAGALALLDALEHQVLTSTSAVASAG